jgi:hypothetical protein
MSTIEFSCPENVGNVGGTPPLGGVCPRITLHICELHTIKHGFYIFKQVSTLACLAFISNHQHHTGHRYISNKG